MYRISLLFLMAALTAVLCQNPAYAQGAPERQLKEVRDSLARQEQEKAKLAAQVQDSEKGLRQTKDKLMKVSSSIRKNEKTLLDLNTRITALETEKTTLQDSLENDRKSLSRLVLSLQKLKRTPPEALIVKPGAPLKTAQSAMLMRDILPRLQQQAEKLSTNLAELDKVSAELLSKKEKAMLASQELGKEKEEIGGLLKQRESLYASSREDLDAQEKEIRRIAAQAQDLQDLVGRLRQQQSQNDRTAGSSPASFKTARVSMPRLGTAQLPVSGPVRVHYNEKDAFGGASKGIKIEGPPGGIVVAPMGGVVRFAEKFKNYGNMVIVEHKDGLHSLIAGLEKIDTVVGQTVTAGEPVGRLRDSKSMVYYELRRNGTAVNPAEKFRDAG